MKRNCLQLVEQEKSSTSNIQKVIYKIGIKNGVRLGGKGDEADKLDSHVEKEAQAYKEKTPYFWKLLTVTLEL